MFLAAGSSARARVTHLSGIVPIEKRTKPGKGEPQLASRAEVVAQKGLCRCDEEVVRQLALDAPALPKQPAGVRPEGCRSASR
eukprot:7057202-Prymnesium_polylepis.1